MKLLRDIRERDWFWIENILVDREDLTIYEKMIYIVLARHSNEESFCFPSYKTISAKCGCSERQAKNVIKSLEEKGLIKKENRTRDNSNEKESNIYLVLTAKVGCACDAQHVVNMMHNPSAPHAQQVVHEVHSNNTNINNTNLTSNIYSLAKQKEDKTNDKDIHKRIIDYLNEKADKSFKSTTKKTKSLIDARLAEGFVEEDFYKVIDNKVHAWLEDAKMSVYLRPETLFGNKFESYLNEVPRMAKNGNESVKQNKEVSKNKFANFEQTFTQYSNKELDEIIKKSQKAKFEK
ncbi:conserved phage C-terminal domain-containing protein [Clostridioides sp. GD02404]|uniref:conserved phage C-terminal domain-containing protein n=1 Tax=Clostridioides sp. GD02404 TaxID=3054354 RepID=UPI00389D4AA5